MTGDTGDRFEGLKRRGIVRTIGGLGAIGLAGCLADDDSGDGAGEDDPNGDSDEGEETSGDDGSNGDSDEGEESDGEAVFEVAAVDPGDVTVARGDTIEVIATVENVGDGAESQTVFLFVDGATEDSAVVDLSGGESATPVFELETDDVDPGEYTYTVSTRDAEASAALTVLPPYIRPPYGVNFGGEPEEEEPLSELPVEIDGIELESLQDATAIAEHPHVSAFGDEHPTDPDWYDPPTTRVAEETDQEFEGTDHDVLYQTYLFGLNFGFEFAVENGTYDVVLHNSENFHSTTGQRLFDVAVQGETVVEEYDLYDVAGDHVAETLVVEGVEVVDETLTIETETHEDMSKFAGIEIREA